MKKRKFMLVINWLMLISLIVVFVTGMVIKVMPGMWLGISHGVSGLVFVICAIIHCVQHGMLKMAK